MSEATYIKPTHETFELWIAELEKKMDDWAAKHGGRPYGDGSLAETTGLECWQGYYDDGYSPSAAFSEDQSYWDED
jgi:hypothetical protein